MWEVIKLRWRTYAAYPVLVAALGIIFFVGHRHWFAPAPTPEVVIEQPVEQPVAKPAKKKRKVKSPRKTQPEKPQPAPKTRPYRECIDGYCWTYF